MMQETIAAPGRSAAPRRLLLSIHDVSPRHEAQTDWLWAYLSQGRPTPIALLVVPNFWLEAPIIAGTPFASRLRDWAEAGAEIFLHGYTHRDNAVHTTAAARLKAKRMTAGEGEFLGLGHAEAARRLHDGQRLIEDVTGRALAGFVAPAWLYGDGAKAALAETSLPLAEDHWRVWEPQTGAVLARSPVITWATRTPLRKASSLAVAALARVAPRPRIVRVGVHPGDCNSRAVMSSIVRSVASLRRTHRPSRYADLMGDRM